MFRLFASVFYGDYSIRIKNHGRTIARVEGFQFHSLVAGKELNVSAFDTDTINFSTLLGSGDTSTVAANANFIAGIDETIRNNRKRAYARIGVTYRDLGLVGFRLETS